MTVSLKKIFSVILSLLIGVSYAQIQQISSHYMFNPQVANPAFYGYKVGVNFGANYRHQWAQLDGQPKND
jgi:hypothetical protein